MTDTQVTELSEKALVILDLGEIDFAPEEEIIKVIREHETSDSTELEVLDLEDTGAWIDEATNHCMVLVKTDKFSTYTFAKTAEPIAVTDIQLDEIKKEASEDGKVYEVVLNTIGAIYEVAATVSPANANDSSLTWSSSDTTVATVDADGKVTAVGIGKATITATANDRSGVSGSVAVVVKDNTATVTPTEPVKESGENSGSIQTETAISAAIQSVVAVKNFTVANMKNELKPNEMDEVKNEGEDAKISMFVSNLGTVSDLSIAEQNKVNAQLDALPGTADPTVLCTMDVSVFKTVGDEAERITETSTPVKLEFTIPDDAKLSDDDAETMLRVYFLTKIHDGVASTETLSYNSTTGIATANLDEFSTYVLGYYDIKKVQSITISGNTATLTAVGATTQLTATVAPADADVKDVVWKSSNPSVATVDATGKVTAVANGTATITATAADGGEAFKTCTIKVDIPVPDPVKEAPNVSVFYRTHVQSFGWQGYVKDGTMSGTSGLARRLEGINIYVSGNDKLGIQYTTHVQTYGWLPWSANNDMSGTEGESKRLEAIKIQLTGEDADKYDVYYRVHAQSFGWLAWAKNGEAAGTAGLSRRLEGIQIVVVKKGQSFNTNADGIASTYASAYVAAGGASLAPEVAGAATPNVQYKTHVQSFGWQNWVYNGKMSGTEGLARRLEGINIKLSNTPYSGGIQYRTHIQSFGWETDWKQDGEMSGTEGLARRLEAIQITLTGEMAEHYDVYYRVHAQTFGWLDWAKNGEAAGTAGLARRLEGIQIVLVPKGGAAPSATYEGITSYQTNKFISN